MCRPDHFAVDYEINPWMDPRGWASESEVLTADSRLEWSRLYRALRGAGAQIELVPPAAGLPDLVFTANAAVVLDGKALLARFRHPQRQPEEPHFADAFRTLERRGLVDSVTTLPEGVVLEGAGDCVFDRTRNLFWMGYGPRSDAAAKKIVEAQFGVEAVSLELADPRFYHMDTALCPLTGGDVLYYPGAFTPEGRALLHARIAPAQRIEIGFDDARRFAANAVCLGDTVIMSGCSEDLRARLRLRGYGVTLTPLDSFLRSGGSAFCLTLRLDRRSAAMPAEAASSAA
jgi:N-dimethylarginine dimethylaminohydrolase